MQNRGKTLLIGLICLLLFSALLFGCERRQGESVSEPTAAPTEAPTYRIDFGEQRDAFVDVKDRYAAGEKVRLMTYMVMDATPVVTADGERLSPSMTEDYQYLVYTFVMPEHDVTVTYRIEGSDMMMQPFHISYEGYGVIDPIEAAYPDETVLLKVGLVFDEITEVYVNGEKIRQVEGPDSDYLYFAFEMPYEDVTVSVESRNISGVE